VALIELLSPAAEQYHYTVLLLPLAILWRDAWLHRSKICARRGRRGDFSNRMADPLQIAAPYVGVPAELPAIVRWLDFVRGLANDLAKHK